MSSFTADPSTRPGLLDRLLSPISKVRPGEGPGALLLAGNVFILLATYYLLKTIREPLILDQPGGAEIKSLATALQAVLFLIVVPIYSAIASRFSRIGLMASVNGFFVFNIAIFCALGLGGVNVGVPYYLWVGIFNMLAVSQFWAFANDLYTEEEGKRLFPIVGIGASLGALVGSVIAEYAFKITGPFQLMSLAALLLAVYIGIVYIVHRRELQRGGEAGLKKAQSKLDTGGGFQLVLRDNYLRMIAAVVLLLSCVNSTGEYILSRFVTESAQSLPDAQRGAFIGSFYGDYFTWVNLLGLLMQTFLVSRLFQWIGVYGALFVLPTISFSGYGLLVLAPTIAIIRAAKILENATDYSLNNTVRAALFLPTSREAKYKGKAAIDTFFVRLGDMGQYGVVFIGTQLIQLSVAGFAMVNMLLTTVWMLACYGVVRQYKRLVREHQAVQPEHKETVKP